MFMMQGAERRLFDRAIAGEAVLDSFRRLGPRRQDLTPVALGLV
jgi:hypothetical protein